MRIVLLGAPGAGKGTQAELIVSEYEVTHISTGDILRKAVKDGTELGRTAEAYMTKGELVPDEVVIGIAAERIGLPDCVNGFLLDGFPRTVAQAEALDKALTNKLDVVLSLDVDENEVIRRLGSRRVCQGCGRIYVAEDVTGDCPACGGKLIIRADDQPEAIKRRLQVYRDQTEPLVSYYRNAGILKTVQAVGDIEDVFERVKTVLKDVS